MEDFNCQMIVKKTLFWFWMKKVNVVLVAATLVLNSCLAVEDRYLFPASSSYNSADSNEQILFQKFSEDFLVDNEIGVHYLGDIQQKLKTMTGEVTTALHSQVARHLAVNKQYPHLSNENFWGLTIGELDSFAGESAVIGGRIREFSMNATTIARVKTEYEFMIEIECFVGKVREKTIIKRNVRFGQKMINISHSQRVMDKFLNKFIDEAALQVAENIEPLL